LRGEREEGPGNNINVTHGAWSLTQQYRWQLELRDFDGLPTVCKNGSPALSRCKLAKSNPPLQAMAPKRATRGRAKPLGEGRPMAVARTKQRIVFVDDEGIALDRWLFELRMRGFECPKFRDADDCLDFIRTRQRVDLFSVDVMLPSRCAMSRDETDGYLSTGLILAAHIRESYPDTPIVFSRTPPKLTW
jgi:CheY-like chemotaxis protein